MEPEHSESAYHKATRNPKSVLVVALKEERRRVQKE